MGLINIIKLMHCQLILSCAVLSKNLGSIERNNSVRTPRIEPGTAGWEAWMSVPCRPPRASAVCLEILLNSQLAYCALAYSTNTTSLLVQGPVEKHRSNFCDVFQVFSNATTSRTSNSSSSSTSKRPARRGILRDILTRSSSFRLFWSVKVFWS